MNQARPELARYTLSVYLLGNLLFGAAVPPGQRFVAAHFGRAGIAVAHGATR